MSLISKIQSLISSANAVTGESRTDLTSAVQDLKDGYGGSTVEKGLVFSEYDSDGYPHKAEFVGFTTLPTSYARSIFERGRFGQYITELVLPQSMTTLSNVSENNALQRIVLHSGITGVNTDACYGNSSLTDVNFEDSSIDTISSGSFRNTRIPIIKFPATLTSIRVGAFYLCSATTEVHFLGNAVNIEQTVFSGCTAITLYDFSNATSIPSLYAVNALGHANGCVIKVPQSLLSTWQAETNWSALTNVTWQGV